ncbi:aldose 1-epimerase family protein, partial [bacterium]|nr:aldose 1-epimerase family protein [bacterium]
GDDYEMWLEGSIRESSFFGFDLQLSRRLSTRLGESRLKIVDRVENLADRACPLMLLYHCNFGFPIVDAGARLVVSQKSVRPRDAAAKPGLETHKLMDSPQSGYAEQVFFHELNEDNGGFATATIVNDELTVAGFVSFRKKELPEFIQWKQMGTREYVLGLEPANCLVLGREAERKRGTLEMLKPGETKEVVLYLGIEVGKEAVAELVRRIEKQESLLDG